MKFLSFTAVLLLAAIFSNGVSAQQTRRANVDMNGDGITDWLVTRGVPASHSVETNDGSFNKIVVAKSYRERMRLRAERRQQQSQTAESPALDTPISWFTSTNNASATFSAAQLGTLQTDFPIPEDFDGDGKDDIAVWRTGASGAAGFYIMQSTNGTVRYEAFGAEGDDPTVTGDYDGDGKADPAAFRCPETVAAQCYFLYRGSSNNPNRTVTTVPYGFGTVFDLTAAPGDYDGDGRADFCVQRALSNGAAQFVLQRSSDGGTENINWGLASDTIVPGDFDGDRKSDFMVTRNQNGNLAWYLLTRTGGGTGTSPIIWGLYDSDFEVPGDYDNDGKTDVAVWRTSADPDANFYLVKRWTNDAMISLEWGQLDDYPVQNWAVH